MDLDSIESVDPDSDSEFPNPDLGRLKLSPKKGKISVLDGSGFIRGKMIL